MGRGGHTQEEKGRIDFLDASAVGIIALIAASHFTIPTIQESQKMDWKC